MRKRILYLMILSLLLVTIAGCSKKEELESEIKIEEESTNLEENPLEENRLEDKKTEEDTTENITTESITTENITTENITTESTSTDNTSTDNTTIENTTTESKKEGFTIKINGNVGNQLEVNLDDLKAMKDYIFEADFFSLNSYGTKGYTHFKGVNLWKLLKDKAKISDTASQVSIIAVDGYEIDFTISQIQKQDYIDEQNPQNLYPIIIAWEENKVEYDVEDGPPFKLVVGQKEAGDVNKPQWVSNISEIIIK